MFTSQPDFTKRLAIQLSKSSALKKLLKPIYNGYQKLIVNHRNKLFRKHGLKVIKEFDDCLTKIDIKYSLAFGSMLGAIREHGFIKHDIDLDVIMWSDNYSLSLNRALKEYGFKRIRSLTVDDGKFGREETYEKNNVTIDVFYIYSLVENELPYCCTFLAYKDSVSFEDSMKRYGRVLARRIHLPWSKEVIRVDFENIMLPVFVNSQELLTLTYGKDYMIPNPNWKPQRSGGYAYIWDDKKALASFS